MYEERAYFQPFVEGGMGDFLAYLEMKRRPGCWGDDPEIQAMSVFNLISSLYHLPLPFNALSLSLIIPLPPLPLRPLKGASSTTAPPNFGATTTYRAPASLRLFTSPRLCRSPAGGRKSGRFASVTTAEAIMIPSWATCSCLHCAPFAQGKPRRHALRPHGKWHELRRRGRSRCDFCMRLRCSGLTIAF